MGDIFLGLIFISLFFVALAYISKWIAEGIWGEEIFNYGRNPFRRYCKKCRQQQDKHDWSWNNAFSHKTGWWEDTGMIMDIDCECHKSQQYRTLI